MPAKNAIYFSSNIECKHSKMRKLWLFQAQKELRDLIYTIEAFPYKDDALLLWLLLLFYNLLVYQSYCVQSVVQSISALDYMYIVCMTTLLDLSVGQQKKNISFLKNLCKSDTFLFYLTCDGDSTKFDIQIRNVNHQFK